MKINNRIYDRTALVGLSAFKPSEPSIAKFAIENLASSSSPVHCELLTSMAFSSSFDFSIYAPKSSSKIIFTANAPSIRLHSSLVTVLTKLHLRSLSSSASCSSKPLQSPTSPPIDVIVGGGGDNKFPPGNGDGGSGGGDEDAGDGEDYEEIEFGPLMGFDEVIRETEARGIELPSDMLEAAGKEGIRELLLFRYFDLQVIYFPIQKVILSKYLN